MCAPSHATESPGWVDQSPNNAMVDYMHVPILNKTKIHQYLKQDSFNPAKLHASND